MDLEVLRERYEKAQSDIRRLQMEKDKYQTDCDRIAHELERIHSQRASSMSTHEKTQEEIQRLHVSAVQRYFKIAIFN